MPPFPHFKKNRKISNSLSRISTVIMGFYSQYGALLQEKNRGCLMAMFSRKSWVTSEAFPPSTHVQRQVCQRGRGQSIWGPSERLFNILSVFKAWILNLSTFFLFFFFGTHFSTLNDFLLSHSWGITQNKQWLETVQFNHWFDQKETHHVPQD